MSARRDSRLKPLVETARGLDGEATKATVSATRKIAQPIDLQQPSQPNNCSDCGNGKTRKSNNDQFYSPEPLASNEYLDRQYAAAEGSARLLSAILDYRHRHEPWTLGQ